MGEEIEIELLRAELERWAQTFPCEHDCTAEGEPEETCSRHGRKPAELWDFIDAQSDNEARLAKERDDARKLRSKVVALADEFAGLAETFKGTPAGIMNGVFAKRLHAVLEGEG